MPQKRMDKTGKLVTRHVRVEQKAGASTSMPAPSLTKTAKKPAKKPLAKQLAPQMYWLGDDFDWDFGLHRALNLKGSDSVIMNASEVEIYDVLSVASTPNAVALLSGGIKSAEEAETFLRENGLEHLIIDRREITDEAIERRISSYKFIDMKRRYGGLAMNADPKNFLDAARLTDTLALEDFKKVSDGEGTNFPKEILKGTISYDDVMGLGLTLIKDNKYYSPAIFECLEAMKKGEVAHDLEAFKDLLNNRVRGNYSLLESLKLVNELGKEFTSTIQNMDQAHGVYRTFPDLPSSEKKSLISYADKGMAVFHKLTLHDVATLHKGCVPIERAQEMLAADMTVDQIVGAYQNDVNPAVSTGWL